MTLHVLEAELAHVEPAQASVLLWVGWVVPSIQLIAPENNGLDHVAAFGDLTLQSKLLLLIREGKGAEGEREGLYWEDWQDPLWGMGLGRTSPTLHVQITLFRAIKRSRSEIRGKPNPWKWMKHDSQDPCKRWSSFSFFSSVSRFSHDDIDQWHVMDIWLCTSSHCWKLTAANSGLFTASILSANQWVLSQLTK